MHAYMCTDTHRQIQRHTHTHTDILTNDRQTQTYIDRHTTLILTCTYYEDISLCNISLSVLVDPKHNSYYLTA